MSTVEIVLAAALVLQSLQIIRQGLAIRHLGRSADATAWYTLVVAKAAQGKDDYVTMRNVVADSARDVPLPADMKGA